MPVMRTYPPAGIEPIAYSVSPIVFEAIVGGKKSENFSTRIPTALAAQKWPSSCRITSIAKPAKASNQLKANPPQPAEPAASARR